MTKSNQRKLVLLYAMNEMGGGGPRSQVLQHINDQGYWHQNDENDVQRSSRPFEPKWRNEFSYERINLVNNRFMQTGGSGNWIITESGKAYLNDLIGQVQTMPSGEDFLFTLSFYQKLCSSSLSTDGTSLNDDETERQYIAQIAQENMDTSSVPDPVSNEPERIRNTRISGSRVLYQRDPSVARRALARAHHLCEMDSSHPSFLRRNGNVMYMEPHHLIPISFTNYFGVNLDREQNIFSLCSNCHNQIHYGKKEDVRKLLEKLFRSREEAICSILGRKITFQDIFRIYGVL